MLGTINVIKYKPDEYQIYLWAGGSKHTVELTIC